MPQPTPTPIPPVAAAVLDGSAVQIGAAVQWLFPQFNLASRFILNNALLAALSRAGVAIIQNGGHTRPFFIVHLFTVKPEDKGIALSTTIHALEELGLKPLSTVAVFTSDRAWHIVHRSVYGCSRFDETFLKLEDMDAFDLDLAAMLALTEKAREAIKKSREFSKPPEQPENPA